MRSLVLICFLLALAGPEFARAERSPEAEVSRVASNPRFKAAQKVLMSEHGRTVADIIRLTEIPAPPFGEARRAAEVRKDFEATLDTWASYWCCRHPDVQKRLGLTMDKKELQLHYKIAA